MKSTKMIGLLGCLSLFVAGCNDNVKLNLNVVKDLKVRTKLGKEEFQNVAPGQYVLNVSTGSQTASIKLVNSSGRETKFKTKTLQSVTDQINSLESLNVELSGAQLGQPFSISMTKKKNLLSTGAEVTKTESCISGYHTEYTTQCSQGYQQCTSYHQVCHQKPGTNGDSQSDFVCHNVCSNSYYVPGQCHQVAHQVAEYGERVIRGNLKSYNTSTNIRFFQDGAQKASVPTQNMSSEKFVQSFVGVCR